jgi:erythritol transport system substrate-binding protein
MRRFSLLIFWTLALTACNRGELAKPLISIIIPSQDNPYFKAEADGA